MIKGIEIIIIGSRKKGTNNDVKKEDNNYKHDRKIKCKEGINEEQEKNEERTRNYKEKARGIKKQQSQLQWKNEKLQK